MKVYERETRTVIRRFLGQKLSFAGCIASLDTALVRFIPRLKPEELAELRAVMFANNETVMNEMERRGPTA
jgi:hypothetical protein